ncbi:MAG: hypothetical protein WAN31_04180 [Methylovirgula sp.]|jgi:hypothetical protein
MRKAVRLFVFRPGSVRIAILALAAGALTNAAHADPMRILGTLGDAHKSVGLITHYDINTSAHSLDVVAAVPSVSPVSRDVQRQLADDTAREICGEGTAAGVSGWSVRIFMPGETTPAGTCRMGGGHH